jgi:hypothetical protein
MVFIGTIPTAQTKFRYQDLTPVEIARDLGYTSIIPILEPRIRNFIPARVILGLQKHFHELLRTELESLVPGLSTSLRLPVLSALTELDTPEMWFPVTDSKVYSLLYMLPIC